MSESWTRWLTREDEGTELGPWGYMPDDPRVLGEALRARGLAMAASLCRWICGRRAGPEEERESVRSVAVLLKALGARHILIVDGGDPLRMSIVGPLGKDARSKGSPASSGVIWLKAWRNWRGCQDEYGSSCASTATAAVTLKIRTRSTG